jgi:hypothetical protein
MGKRHLMRLSAVLASFLVLVTAQADDPISPGPTTPQISMEQWRAYLAQVKAVPDVHCEDAAANQYICDSASQRSIWVFTREGHLAHPAVSRGIMVIQQTSQGTRVGIDRSGAYAGDRAAFEAWIKEFAVLDKREVAQWQSKLQPK